MTTDGRVLRLSIRPSAWLVLFGGFVAALAVRELVVQAQRPLGWALAAIVAAAALEPPVSWLSARVPRPVAVIGVLLVVAAVIGAVAWLTLRDLDAEYARLREAIPEAAASLERSETFGDAAREFELVEKAEDFAGELQAPSSRAGSRVVSSVGGAFVVLILTLFMLAWGPRLGAAAQRQIVDEGRRRRWSAIVTRAFEGAQRYIDSVFVGAVVVFAVAAGTFELLDLPAAAPLALLAAVASTIPVIGLALGVMPAAALEAGLTSPLAGALLLAAAVIAQLVHQRLLDRATQGMDARPGSAVVLIAFLLGYDLYGVGGALVGAALVVFATALVDAGSTSTNAVGDTC